ncbi:SH3 domain-containing protein [Streptomyces hoynatensis]|uniref:SH3 domain-containing protein n=1 Tax=Streptomyces hoynatensis TaxID=1141874 RepID=A0A3A9YXS2_9ACTN|nr:SH3 domain-containing protein [Streptomyces hoynatensis]RKN40444.1 SH3 domain-containing protein [Streptomyces hoynatensis]
MSRSLLGSQLSMCVAVGAMVMAAVSGPTDERPEAPADGASEPGRVVAAHGADLREAPAPGSPALDTAAPDSSLTVICSAEGGGGSRWYLVHTDTYAWAAAGAVAPDTRPPAC